MIRLYVYLVLFATLSTAYGQGVELAWAKLHGGSGSSRIWDTEFDDEGNVFFGGNYNDSVFWDMDETTLTTTNGSANAVFGRYAADGSLDWVKSIESSQTCQIRSVSLDSDGNLVVMGNFVDSVDFDLSENVHVLISASQSTDIFVAKYTNEGEFIWVNQIGGYEYDIGTDLGIDSDNGVCVAGTYKGVVDFDPSPAEDIHACGGAWLGAPFVNKYLSDGTYEWSFVGEHLGGGYSDLAAFSIDDYGDIYLSVDHFYSVHFPMLTDTLICGTNGSNGMSFIKINSNGNDLWSNTISGQFIEVEASVVIDADHIVLGGSYRGTIDFDPGPNTMTSTQTGSGYHSYIQCFNLEGELEWLSTFGPSADYQSTWLKDLKKGPFGGIYAMGNSLGNFTLNDGVEFSTGSHENAFFFYMGSDGYVHWLERFGSSELVFPVSISVGNLGELVVCGNALGDMGFSPDNDPIIVANIGGNDGFSALYTPIANSLYEESTSDPVRVFPNPSQSGAFECWVSPEDQPREVFVSNALGQVLDRIRIAGGQEFFNLDLPAGTYFIKLLNDDSAECARLISLGAN